MKKYLSIIFVLVCFVSFTTGCYHEIDRTQGTGFDPGAGEEPPIEPPCEGDDCTHIDPGPHKALSKITYYGQDGDKINYTGNVVFTYDDQNRLVAAKDTRESYTDTEPKVFGIMKFEYDEAGKPVKIESYDGDEKLTETFNLSYDQHGTITMKEEVTASIKKTFVYKPEMDKLGPDGRINKLTATITTKTLGGGSTYPGILNPNIQNTNPSLHQDLGQLNPGMANNMPGRAPLLGQTLQGENILSPAVLSMYQDCGLEDNDDTHACISSLSHKFIMTGDSACSVKGKVCSGVERIWMKNDNPGPNQQWSSVTEPDCSDGADEYNLTPVIVQITGVINKSYHVFRAVCEEGQAADASPFGPMIQDFLANGGTYQPYDLFIPQGESKEVIDFNRSGLPLKRTLASGFSTMTYDAENRLSETSGQSDLIILSNAFKKFTYSEDGLPSKVIGGWITVPYETVTEVESGVVVKETKKNTDTGELSEMRTFEYVDVDSEPVIVPMMWIDSFRIHTSSVYANEPKKLFGEWLYIEMR